MADDDGGRSTRRQGGVLSPGGTGRSKSGDKTLLTPGSGVEVFEGQSYSARTTPTFPWDQQRSQRRYQMRSPIRAKEPLSTLRSPDLAPALSPPVPLDYPNSAYLFNPDLPVGESDNEFYNADQEYEPQDEDWDEEVERSIREIAFPIPSLGMLQEIDPKGVMDREMSKKLAETWSPGESIPEDPKEAREWMMWRDFSKTWIHFKHYYDEAMNGKIHALKALIAAHYRIREDRKRLLGKESQAQETEKAIQFVELERENLREEKEILKAETKSLRRDVQLQTSKAAKLTEKLKVVESIAAGGGEAGLGEESKRAKEETESYLQELKKLRADKNELEADMEELRRKNDELQEGLEASIKKQHRLTGVWEQRVKSLQTVKPPAETDAERVAKMDVEDMKAIIGTLQNQLRNQEMETQTAIDEADLERHRLTELVKRYRKALDLFRRETAEQLSAKDEEISDAQDSLQEMNENCDELQWEFDEAMAKVGSQTEEIERYRQYVELKSKIISEQAAKIADLEDKREQLGETYETEKLKWLVKIDEYKKREKELATNSELANTQLKLENQTLRGMLETLGERISDVGPTLLKKAIGLVDSIKDKETKLTREISETQGIIGHLRAMVKGQVKRGSSEAPVDTADLQSKLEANLKALVEYRHEVTLGRSYIEGELRTLRELLQTMLDDLDATGQDLDHKLDQLEKSKADYNEKTNVTAKAEHLRRRESMRFSFQNLKRASTIGGGLEALDLRRRTIGGSVTLEGVRDSIKPLIKSFEKRQEPTSMRQSLKNTASLLGSIKEDERGSPIVKELIAKLKRDLEERSKRALEDEKEIEELKTTTKKYEDEIRKLIAADNNDKTDKNTDDDLFKALRAKIEGFERQEQEYLRKLQHCEAVIAQNPPGAPLNDVQARRLLELIKAFVESISTEQMTIPLVGTPKGHLLGTADVERLIREVQKIKMDEEDDVQRHLLALGRGIERQDEAHAQFDAEMQALFNARAAELARQKAELEQAIKTEEDAATCAEVEKQVQALTDKERLSKKEYQLYQDRLDRLVANRSQLSHSVNIEKDGIRRDTERSVTQAVLGLELRHLADQRDEEACFCALLRYFLPNVYKAANKEAGGICCSTGEHQPPQQEGVVEQPPLMKSLLHRVMLFARRTTMRDRLGRLVTKTGSIPRLVRGEVPPVAARGNNVPLPPQEQPWDEYSLDIHPTPPGGTTLPQPPAPGTTVSAPKDPRFMNPGDIPSSELRAMAAGTPAVYEARALPFPRAKAHFLEGRFDSRLRGPPGASTSSSSSSRHHHHHHHSGHGHGHVVITPLTLFSWPFVCQLLTSLTWVVLLILIQPVNVYRTGLFLVTMCLGVPLYLWRTLRYYLDQLLEDFRGRWRDRRVKQQQQGQGLKLNIPAASARPGSGPSPLFAFLPTSAGRGEQKAWDDGDGDILFDAEAAVPSSSSESKKEKDKKKSSSSQQRQLPPVSVMDEDSDDSFIYPTEMPEQLRLALKKEGKIKSLSQQRSKSSAVVPKKKPKLPPQPPSPPALLGSVVSLGVAFTALVFLSAVEERRIWTGDNTVWKHAYLRDINNEEPYPKWSPVEVDFRLVYAPTYWLLWRYARGISFAGMMLEWERLGHWVSRAGWRLVEAVWAWWVW
ncbi:hypothetical protein B0H66DRAFT_78788 [Apodospora peruviana]|uniref:Uncharacterized protein n=1 Tax=Apodospora peruviana TaxID=516989 RepID=A0AAE0MFQ9_9PEZI|nr:hypothetical protein B0H66DRAFT_78788 [Apodospora peruviana]